MDNKLDEKTFYMKLKQKIFEWGAAEGFQQLSISDTDVSSEKSHLNEWVEKGYHASMSWMKTHLEKRLNPQQLLPGTQRIISARMNYLPPDTQQVKVLKSPDKAYISRYALGRDYHKLMRKRLAKIADNLRKEVLDANLMQRAFVDSAPVLERALAAKAGLGWVGKHTLLIHPTDGSWFFLGEIYTNLPLPIDNHPQKNRCGDCEACLKVCPTDAFPRPYQLDASRCISYLTIEHKGTIPEEFREPIGNRVFGCDDCQAICPWNKYAKTTLEKDFLPRHGIDQADLATLFLWDEQTYLRNTEGSPLRRIGYENWLRNLAIGLGNADKSARNLAALQSRLEHPSEILREQIMWALHRANDPRPRKRKIKRS
ncbi:MAG: tRNA epoxyqueuosine(34) reductase QueG [Cellvibrionaceae bacterium]|nr:tRNA epoxyqueuosine(34) reductase QueG [Cellvibrionaceae bacterium]